MLCRNTIIGWILLTSLQATVTYCQERKAVTDSADAGASGFMPLPIFFYTPETGFAGGGTVMYFNRPSSRYQHVRPTTININAIYTEKKQILSELYTDYYALDGLHRINAGLTYNLFPQKFYGVGNNTPASNEEFYTSKSFRFFLDGYRRVSDRLSVGLSYFYENRSLSEFESDGLLISNGVTGSNGGITTGPGILLFYDSRDNIFSAYEGEYYQGSLKVASDALGSEFNYSRIALDARRFIDLGGHHILALQGFAVSINGTTPFYKLDGLGGQSLLRGYYEGRFRDYKTVIAQAEYRSPMVWDFFTGALFVGVGDVASTVSTFRLKDLKPSCGFGIRLFYEPKERLCLRIDFGFGQQSSGFYITAGEAF